MDEKRFTNPREWTLDDYLRHTVKELHAALLEWRQDNLAYEREHAKGVVLAALYGPEEAN